MTTLSATDSKYTKSSTTWWICAGLVLAIVAAYWSVAGYAFTDYDDNDYVWQNSHVLNGFSWSGVVWAFTHFYASNWHPLTWLSHMLDVQLFGLNAGEQHATSLLFHAVNSVLVFLWLKRATKAFWRSAMVAALFGLHPLHVESVAWIAERKDVLSTFFFLLTLMAYTRYVEQFKIQNSKFKISYGLALFCFALGLMSKPMLVTLPFVLLLLDFWPLQRIQNSKFKIQNLKPLLLEKIPFFALSAGSCALTFLAQQSGKAVMAISVLPVNARMENAIISYAAYLKKMLWPDALAVCYPLNFPVNSDKVIMAAFMLLLISMSVFIFWRQRLYLVMGWLWYLGMLVPVIGLVQVGGQSMADRYTYVSLIGPFIAITWLVVEMSKVWPYRRLVLAISSVAVLATCWVLTAAQVRYWQNSEILARHALAVTPDNAAMQILLGNALLEQNKPEEAGQHFAEAVIIWPDSVAAKCELAVSLDAQGRLDEAVTACQAALKLKPNEVKIHHLLGNIFSTQDRWTEAIMEYKAALQTDPNSLIVLNNLSWLLATAPDARFRNGTEAVRLGEHACQLSNYQMALYVGTLAAAYAEAGRFDDAVKTAQKAIILANASNNENLVKKNRKLLELYQQRKAFHEPASH